MDIHSDIFENPESPKSLSKKEKIVEAYQRGEKDILKIAGLIQCRPSYVAQILQNAGLIDGYFDLYTSTKVPQNVYSPFFEDVLSFKNMAAAQESVRQLDSLYRYFESLDDHAGQHHAMTLALIGLNRARWSGKNEESLLFRDWLYKKSAPAARPHKTEER